ncbi:hypothetical protein AB0O75_50685, partial [Streptomyces sp. NPDC088921]|uniref:hypothetical protein n=1 Tax=Streptomyces sp. NPDC088921 TaxID=3155062 RepID=UPI0034269F7F
MPPAPWATNTLPNSSSRVQKEARSAAEAGWDVVLLGKAKGKKGQTWQIGAGHVGRQARQQHPDDAQPAALDERDDRGG